MFNSFFTFLTRRVTPPFVARLEAARARFTKTEQVLFGALFVLLAASTLALAAHVGEFFLIDMPRTGGALTEGIVGTPRFVNPLLALSDADRDLTALVYAGLLRATPEGTLIADLAEKYEISADGRSYTFTLKENARFHDGVPVTADDVVFTILKAQDPLIKSVKRANWEGVVVEKISDRVVRFTLKQPYAPFLENTTLGILPKHLWSKIDAEGFQFNTLNGEPVGAGPYRVARVDENASRIPTAYTLEPFADYTLGAPYIARIVLRFYGNEAALANAFERKEIESMGGVSPATARALEAKGYPAFRVPLPRIFGVFFNENQSKILTDKSVRAALDAAVDKQNLVDTLLLGYGAPLEGPLPPGTIGSADSMRAASTDIPLETAKKILEDGGWKLNNATGVREKTSKKETQTLALSLATASAPELRAAAEYVATAWRALGADVALKFFDGSDLNQTVIRPRAYDALLFGEIVGRDLDLFAFWHSSQRNDPGLNIALYTNIKADRLLEEARTAQTKEARNAALAGFAAEVAKDIPAVFLYAPDYVYFLPPKVKGVSLDNLALPHERWNTIYRAYINTEKVWPFFMH